MKKFILPLVLLFAIASAGFASSNLKTTDSPSGIPQVKSISIDLGDITNMTESEVSETITKLLEAELSALPVLQCSVTISAKFTCGVMEVSVSVTVSGDCSEVRSSGRAIANEIIDDVKSYFKKYYH
jgi:hypothetical protein